MTNSADAFRSAFSVGCILLTLGTHANAELPQISEGVRATMFTVKGVKSGPDNARYMLQRQPPIYEYLPSGARHFFPTEDKLIDFFQSFPVSVQARGLWITRAVPPNGETEEDGRRVDQLVKQALQKNLLLYICNPAPSRESGLMGWECTKQSPQQSKELISCLPRTKPHLGHPWWDCLIKEAK